jgi:hypothetical protein
VNRGTLWWPGSSIVMTMGHGSASMGLVREMTYGCLRNFVGVASANKV